MKKKQPFNCGNRLEGIMNEQGWSQGFVSELLDVTRQNVSQKINKNDMKVSEVEKIMWAMGKELFEFFILPADLEKQYELPVKWVELGRKINMMSEDQKTKLYALIEQAVSVALPPVINS